MKANLQTMEAARAFWIQQTPEPWVDPIPAFMRPVTCMMPELTDEPWEADRPWHLRFTPDRWFAFMSDVDRTCGPLYRMHMERL